MLDIVANYYYIPFQEKLKNQNWENGKKTNFGADFGSFDSNLVPKSFFMGFTSTWYCYKLYKLSLNTISRKTKEPNLSKWQKSSFGSDFGPFGPNLSCFFFFFFFQKSDFVSHEISWSAIIMYTIVKSKWFNLEKI